MDNHLIKNKFPLSGWLGLCLLVIAWTVNWSLSGLRTHLLFFPLWLGYSLFINGLVYYRTGSSLLTRSIFKYISLFVISAPSWWLFELINCRSQNWHYIGIEQFTKLEYAFWATLNFSTVIPAVFATAELVRSFSWINRVRTFIKIKSSMSMILFFAIGLLMLILVLAWPKYFYPFVWLSLFFIFDTVNVWLKNHSLFNFLKIGDWRPVWSLWLGCLTCGFFWEFWNYWSSPKWIYTTPFVQFFHIFEMPVLGYLGYLPFSLELYALYHLVIFVAKKENYSYIKL